MEKKNLQFRFDTRNGDVVVINVYTVAGADVFIDEQQRKIIIMNDTRNRQYPKSSEIAFPTHSRFIGASV